MWLRGDGNFAVVRACRRRDDDPAGAEYAMKVIDKAKLANKVDMVENEIAIMKRCRHVNIVRLYEEYETRSHIYLIMQLVTCSTVDTCRSSFVLMRTSAGRLRFLSASPRLQPGPDLV